ncbi:Exoenzymes regulatory protein AepA precursor [Leucobacter sp. 7(1)]|uniref:amidohydrolase n=1 Tax=Leucobacter sp. 7(1) TaxID=1255613 RepID=UPI00097EC92E|nr:amidohydrolase [Leucobacter sp. 7(1)]SJN09227.1 Exoenzymes regulatory protein AepA precursor [Leucobacter sp. 7(1)]
MSTLPFADRLLTAAGVHTMTAPTGEPPTAVAISEGRVLAVGTRESLQSHVGPNTQVDAFPSGTITPGLTDGHTHIVFGLELTRGVQLTDLTLPEAQAAVAAATAAATAGEWVFGWGLDPNIFTGTGFTGKVFDAATGEHPAFLRMRDAHSAVINSAAIERVGLTGSETFPDESAVGIDESGAPTGYLLELAAMTLVLEQIPEEPLAARAERLSTVLSGMAGSGITGTHVMDFHPGSREVLELLESRAELPLRLRFSPMVPPGATDEELTRIAELQGLHGRRWRVEGVKFMIDGTVDNGSAWLAHPDCYGEGLRSIWTDPHAYRRALRFFAERGIATATHAIGDQGVSFVLDAIESLGEIAGRAAHRIEHIETIPDSTVPRFAALGVAASMQPIHGTRHTRADRSDNWSVRLGEERARHGWRCKDLRDSGAVLALGSDWPVTPFDPREMMAETILRIPLARPELAPVQPEQALNAREALEGYTTHAARAIGATDEGALVPGARAALTVFAADPLAITPQELAQTPVLATYVDGVPVA